MKVNLFLDKKYYKDADIKKALEDYRKRCSRFVDIKLFYKIDLKLFLDSTSYNINVTKNGELINSELFSKVISRCSLNRFKNLNILFENKDLKFNRDICFCNIDLLSTGFLYVMVVEQIYRSYKIINNEPYHK